MLQKNTNTKHANVKVTKNNGSGSDAGYAAKNRGVCMVIRWQSHTDPKGVGQYIHHKMEKAKK